MLGLVGWFVALVLSLLILIVICDFAGVWYCGLGFMGSFGDFGFRLVFG